MIATALACRSELRGRDRERLSTDALRFARLLMTRDFVGAHAMMTTDFQARVSVDSLAKAFDAVIPQAMRPVDSLYVLMTDRMTGWKTRRAGDLGWVYVVIPADSTHDGEAVAVVFAAEGAAARIRDMDIGRP